MKVNWDIIHECDDEDGNPTCWATEINHPKYGKYVWISKNSDNHYDVEVNYDSFNSSFTKLVTCKSLTSAKRWTTKNLLKREAVHFYTKLNQIENN